MDYGKLAYLKAEDLEGIVGRLSKKQTDFSGVRANYEIGRTIDGNYKITDIKPGGGGSICLIVKLYATSVSKTFVDFMIGDKPAARQIVYGTDKEYLVLLQVKISDNAEFSLRTEGVFVSKIDLMVIGGSAAYGGKSLFGDAGGGNALVFLVCDEVITGFFGLEKSLDFAAEGRTEAVGQSCDVLFLGGEFYVAILDLYGNIWLKNYSAGGRYKFITGGAEGGVALSNCAGGICLATVMNGKIVTCFLDSFADSPQFEDAEINIDALTVKFAKGDDRPLLAIKAKNGGSCFAVAEKETKAGERVSVRIIAYT